MLSAKRRLPLQMDCAKASKERETEARHAQTHVYLLETLSWTNGLMQELKA
jgi:hypothetical protein